MKRRKLLHYGGVSALTAAAALTVKPSAQAQTRGMNLKWLGHTCFLFSGSGKRILVNPFRTIGCTAGYRLPRVPADLVLISSQLFDEGAAENLPGNPDILFEPGAYEAAGIRFQGIAIAHDRVGGRRFGENVAWVWNQGGVKILHLGGAAAPIEIEQQILMGRPDILLLPVGGGPKAYNAQEAFAAMQLLNPRLVIPTHYRTQAAGTQCDIEGLETFLSLVDSAKVSRINSDSLTVAAADLPSETAVRVLRYSF
ncbi:MAG: MBL fold metallo-hydrolase [Jaaginema sp. PMC 1079.18]|nr:MBL fold metallo-hydrolase [Jaaginema sp. PMC 1080.18]MEC4851342.1 MBL fold metallo-hydrolase [Jaaginema sp. PMC 1079.18]MEC4865232.1 MBL fold metallo-hydrolase [Jaaginema sp. PMC 1078.18]